PVSMSELWKIVTKGINKPLMEQGLDTQDWAQAYENFVNFTKSHNYLAFRAPFPGIGDKMETISFLFILFQQKAQAFVVVDDNPLRTADENKLRRWAGG
ncbi:MAG: hypothetical protein KDD44_09485, partial [Bdellovibrionales bacterium]|nr:hypothetical protein [Bdellovibrionales bacterium]